MKRRFWFVGLTGAALITLCFSPVQAQRGNKGVKQNYLVRADFRDAIDDGVGSEIDGSFTCDTVTYDYIDSQDTCLQDAVEIASRVGISKDAYFLATRASTDPNPTHFLVLDFGAANNPLECPTLFGNSTCEHKVTVKFGADNAFTSGATSSAVHMDIEWFPLGAPYWITRYQLNFINPVTRTASGNVVTIGDTGPGGDDFMADLWELSSNARKKTRLGTFVMPFQLVATKTNQIFNP